MLEFLRTYQLDILLMLCSACALSAVYMCIAKTLPKNRKRILLMLEIYTVILLASDRLAYIYRGDVSSTGFWMVRISNFLVFLMTLGILRGFNAYVADLAVHEGGMDSVPKALSVSKVLVIAGELLLVISQFTGLYYTFDETNHYQRAGGFVIAYVIPLICLIIQIATIIKMRKCFRGRIFTSLIVFTGATLLASLLQAFVYGISFTNMTVALTGILLFVFALSDMDRRAEQANDLEMELLRAKAEMSQGLFDETARALVDAIDAKDKYTHGHSSRVADYSRMIAEALGKSEEECDNIYYAALLHDVGKIGIPESIINKEGKLTDEEYEVIKQHPAIGGRILSNITEFPYICTAAKYHHERYDGNGYPEGMKGKDIPEIGRIVAVADAYDAMHSDRVYRLKLSDEQIKAEFERCKGTQFDPEMEELFIKLIFPGDDSSVDRKAM